MTWPGFTTHLEKLDEIRIGWTIGGKGPPVLMLHGFPQTRALWAKVAPVLARDFTVICPDLRGYGQSDKPASVADYTFRKMARDQIVLLKHLGFENAAVIGHDRGGRVGHRMALDHPDFVTRLCVLDIIPTHTLLKNLRMDVARSYYHWFFLAQPEPLPERLITADPDLYFASCLSGWGKAGLDKFDPHQLEQYRTAWKDPDTIRGMCNDYRATLRHDVQDDEADLSAKVTCPLSVLYGQDGAMAALFDFEASWLSKGCSVDVRSLPGGHFFIDSHPDQTLAALLDSPNT